MSIRIKENEKPSLPLCHMNCDDGLAEKLNKYELTKFLNKYSCNLMVGKPGSGKTSLLYSFFKNRNLLKKVFHKIFYFAPASSQASMKDNIFEVLPEEQRFFELSYENLDYALQYMRSSSTEDQSSKKENREKTNFCLIFDDMGAYLKNPDCLKLFKEIVYNKRHLHCTMFFLVQSWYSVVKDTRRLFDNLFIFKTSKNELTNIFEEVVESHKDDMPEISKIVYEKPYQFLFINTSSGRMFRGFDELIFNDVI